MLELAVPVALGIGSMIMGNKSSKSSAPKASDTEKMSGMIGMSRYQMATGINNAQMKPSLRAANANHEQHLRNNANTQAMMGMTNSFMGLGGNAASGAQGQGVSATLGALTQASNIARSGRLQRLAGAGQTLNGNAQMSNTGLTSLGSMASNAALRQMQRDMEARNARQSALMTIGTGAALGYMDRPTSAIQPYQPTQIGMNPNGYANPSASYLTRPMA